MESHDQMNQIPESELLQAYLTVITATQPQVVPGRDLITFVSKKSGLPQLWSWSESTGECRQIVEMPDRVVTAKHSPCGAKTLIGMDHKGNEKQQLYVLDHDTLQVEELVVSPQHFHYPGGWSPCGKLVVYSTNRRGPGLFDLYVADIETKQERAVYEYNGKCVPLIWLPDGSGLLFVTEETNVSQYLHVLDLATGTARRIGVEGDGLYASVQLTKDGSGYLLTNSAENTMALYRFSPERAGAELLLQAEGWDIEEAKLSPDGSKLAYTVNEGGMSALYIYELASSKSMRVADQPRAVIQTLGWMDADRLVFTLKSPVLPGDVWSYSTGGQTFRRLTYFGVSEHIEPLLREAEVCAFASFDGVEVPYFYYRPDTSRQAGRQAGEKAPTVVYVHGGPESQIRFEFHPVLQYLVGQGFNVIAPNVRGSSGYGKAYLSLDNARKRMDSVADLAALVKDLARFEEIDTGNIGIMGRSYGGFMVLAALTHYPDLWAAGVDIVGITHFRTFLQNTGEWRRKLRESEYGTLADDSDFFEEIAPLNHSHKIKVPLLIFHGRNDTRVPVSEAEQLYAEMKQRGQAAELFIFEDEGHYTEKMENHIELNTRIIRFFRRELEK